MSGILTMMKGRTEHRGFSLIELIVIISIITLLSLIGFKAYQSYVVKSRDSERRLAMNSFVKKLEAFKNEFGAYPCGDACVTVSGQVFSYDCSDVVNTISGNDPGEVNGFLNGGECCGALGGTPAPASPNDSAMWGLYRHGYTDSITTNDPLEATVGGLQYSYCYAVPAVGRTSYALFARMESQTSQPSNDGDLCTMLYDIESPQYPTGGWTPDPCGAIGAICGNGVVEGSEQCDSANLNGQTCVTLGFVSGALSCTGTCQFNTSLCSMTATCGDSIVSAGEQCDQGPFDTYDCDYAGGFGSQKCTFATCGDGYTNYARSEECDPPTSQCAAPLHPNPICQVTSCIYYMCGGGPIE